MKNAIPFIGMENMPVNAVGFATVLNNESEHEWWILLNAVTDGVNDLREHYRKLYADKNVTPPDVGAELEYPIWVTNVPVLHN